MRLKACVGLLDPNTVLDQPFVDSFRRMGHIDFASEIGLSKDVGKGRCMVEMKTISTRCQYLFPEHFYSGCRQDYFFTGNIDTARLRSVQHEGTEMANMARWHLNMVAFL